MHKKLIIMKFKSTLEIIDMKYIVWKFNGITVDIIGWRGVLDTTLCDQKIYLSLKESSSPDPVRS